MKKIGLILLVMTVGLAGSYAQLTVKPAMDIYSSYIWRGTQYGTGPAFQPSVVASVSNFSLGVWGSFDAMGYKEADLFLSYTLPFGLTLAATDYYYPGKKYLDYSDTSGSHAFEAGLSYTLFEKLTLSGYYIFNEAGGAGTKGGDTYVEAAYAFAPFTLFVGAGNGWYTSDGEFNVCNVGIKSTKEIKVTDSFSIPVSGSIVFNPEREQLYVVVGLSF
ncbi:MAG: hypothetical protein N2662_10075 [Bacteroidales bacterium]|nr:hypothetical protein [Bacteroidales bacterium]